MAPKSLDLKPDSYRFIQSQFAKPVPIPKETSLAGGTVIITGANIGIGYGAAEMMLSLHLTRLIIAVRTRSKGESAAAQLRTEFPSAQIDVWEVDMASFESVRAFANKCETLDRIDLVLLNAGIQLPKFELSPDGHETSYQVNYLSTVLLATLLLPTLKHKAPAGQPGRLTITNSGTALIVDRFRSAAHEKVLPFFDDPATYSVMNAYSSQKALAHFWVLKLAERVKADDVVVNLVDPGLVKNTGLQRNGNIFLRSIGGVFKSLFGRTVEQGASTLVHAGVVLGKESHGSYIMDWRIFQ
ncbi:hypothetical protein F66182_7321 [Fusarium sp. NRRL 66182]|nr:hypothetical protein F66182_7321 [Fusarium sp. NRRL 66182]